MTDLRFYLDENIHGAVVEQLNRWGIDAVSAVTLDALGDTDETHLQRATQLGRVFCTHDRDLLRLNAQGVEHAGIAFMSQFSADIGDWVRELLSLQARLTAEDAKGQVFYLKTQRR